MCYTYTDGVLMFSDAFKHTDSYHNTDSKA
jgi:hypothetical protein